MTCERGGEDRLEEDIATGRRCCRRGDTGSVDTALAQEEEGVSDREK